MRIWLINHYALTPEYSGGTRHYDIAQALIRRGHDVTIIASSFHYATFKQMKSYPAQSAYLLEEIDGIQFVWIKTKPYTGNGLARVLNMLEFTQKLRGLRFVTAHKPDVIVGSSVHLFAVYGAYRLAKYFHTPFVMEVRDIWPQTLMDMGVSKFHPFVIVLGWLEPFLYRRADRIITLLPLAQDHIEQFGIEREIIDWISNGVNLQTFEQASPSQRLNPSKFNLLYTGTMGKANNLEALIEAAKILQPLEEVAITLVGSGPLQNALKLQAEGVTNIMFLPPIPKAEIPALLQEADVLFVGLKDLPLYRFGMSMNKVFDYMAAAKPIIFASNVSENPVQKADAGLIVPPDDAIAIANALKTLYNSTTQVRKQTGVRGFQYVKAHFGMDVIGAKFESTLKKAKNGNKKN